MLDRMINPGGTLGLSNKNVPQEIYLLMACFEAMAAVGGFISCTAFSRILKLSSASPEVSNQDADVLVVALLDAASVGVAQMLLLAGATPTVSSGCDTEYSFVSDAQDFAQWDFARAYNNEHANDSFIFAVAQKHLHRPCSINLTGLLDVLKDSW